MDRNCCPLCGEPLRKLAGKFGPFYGCTGFPECRVILGVRQVDGNAPIDPEEVRAKVEARFKGEKDKRVAYNLKVDESLAEWRAAMLAADTSTEPPFDPDPPRREPEPSVDDLDAEFAAMFR